MGIRLRGRRGGAILGVNRIQSLFCAINEENTLYPDSVSSGGYPNPDTQILRRLEDELSDTDTCAQRRLA